MSNNESTRDTAPAEDLRAGIPIDSSGNQVNVVERDIEDTDDDTRAVDETITPTSTRAKEQDAETLKQKTAEIERKVADGN
jgi:hypothetical protein